MSFDIYGGRLRPGHCEVHPNVHESYPCSVCMMESQRQHDEKKRYEEEMQRAMKREYEECMAEEITNMDGGGI